MEINRKKVLIKLMLFAIFIAVIHYIALKFYLYWTTPIDILMHILGGALVSAIGLWCIYYSPFRNYFLNNSKKILFSSVFIAFVIGFLWEVFELQFGLISHDFIDRIDSVKDLLDDIVGALFVGLYFVNNLIKNGRN